MKNPVFVLSLFDTGYCAARQLRKIGCPILGFDYNKKNVGFYSRFIQAQQCPHPTKEEKDLLLFLLDKRRAFMEKPLLIPASELFVFFMNNNLQALKEEFLFILPENMILEEILNKETQIFRAEKSGLNISPIISWDLTGDTIPDIQHKVIIRGSDQIQWKNKITEKAFVVGDQKALAQSVKKLKDNDIRFICQKLISGDVSNNFEYNALMINGRIVHSHIIQKLYQYPLDFGSACAVMVVRSDKVDELGRKFVLENKIEGFSNTEFKYDPASGKYFFIETNPRVWQQIELATSLDDNIMVRYYQFLTEGVNSPVSITLKYKQIWIDLPSFSLLYYKFRKESGLGFGKLVKYLMKANYYGVFNLLDINPFIKTVLFK